MPWDCSFEWIVNCFHINESCMGIFELAEGVYNLISSCSFRLRRRGPRSLHPESWFLVPQRLGPRSFMLRNQQHMEESCWPHQIEWCLLLVSFISITSMLYIPFDQILHFKYLSLLSDVFTGLDLNKKKCYLQNVAFF